MELEEAVKSDPSFWKAFAKRGTLKDWYKSDRQGALADLDQAIKLGPADYEVYNAVM